MRRPTAGAMSIVALVALVSPITPTHAAAARSGLPHPAVTCRVTGFAGPDRFSVTTGTRGRLRADFAVTVVE